MTVISDKSQSSVIRVWDDQLIDAILIDQSGSKALAFDQKQNVAVIDLQTNEISLRLADRESSTISPDGRWIVSADRNMILDVFDGATLQRVRSLKEIDPTDKYITFSNDSRLFVSVGTHRMVTVWDTETWSVIQRISVPSRGLHRPTFHPDGRTLGFCRCVWVYQTCRYPIRS